MTAIVCVAILCGTLLVGYTIWMLAWVGSAREARAREEHRADIHAERAESREQHREMIAFVERIARESRKAHNDANATIVAIVEARNLVDQRLVDAAATTSPGYATVRAQEARAAQAVSPPPVPTSIDEMIDAQLARMGDQPGAQVFESAMVGMDGMT